MRKKLTKFMACLMAFAIMISAMPTTSMAYTSSIAKSVPAKIESCESYFGSDFYINFDSSSQKWLESITSITVAGTEYSKVSYSFYVNRNTSYHVKASDGILLIGEGGITTGIADCIIKATGYENLVLELDKSTHKAVVKDLNCEHSGGTATCKEKAVCEKCGQNYGEFGSHKYGTDDKCNVCGEEKPKIPAAPEVSIVEDNGFGMNYLIFGFDADKYVEGITDISVNGTAWTKQNYKIALNGSQYYLNTDENRVYFASQPPLKSGDIMTIKNPSYEDIRLKVTIVNGTLSIKNADDDATSEDEYTLHVRLVGSFEAALVNQKGYDAISGASTNITQNKNSNVSVEAVVLPKDQTPEESDWKLLCDSDIKIDSKETTVHLDSNSGMVGVYSVYDSSLTLAGTPSNAGTYPVSVTVTDDQGRTAISNELIFKVYSGEEYLEEQLIYENCTETADGKYMYDMEPWKIKNFDKDDQVVTVPKDIKAWYGSHTSGTYGELGYAIPEGNDTTQTLIIPNGCNLTLVNMDILSSVRIVVENGASLVLRDSVIQGVVEVKNGGTFSMNYNGYDGEGEFLNGASINGTVILQDGATLENSKIYSNTNNIANGNEARHNIKPVLVINGTVNLKGKVFLRGDEAPTGTDPTTELSYAGQTGIQVNGTLNITKNSVLAVYGGGRNSTTSNGGVAVILNNGTITGEGKLIAIGGNGTFGNGGNAVEGNGTISVTDAYLRGGNSYFPKEGMIAGKPITKNIKLAGNTNRNLIDGKVIKNNSEDDGSNLYWSDITTTPDLSLYPVEQNAPGDIGKDDTDKDNTDKDDINKDDTGKDDIDKDDTNKDDTSQDGDKNDDNSNSDVNNPPKTGDNTPIALLFTALIASGLSIGFMIRKRKIDL